jgi:thiol-disulfide isomerase/thioredoxin
LDSILFNTFYGEQMPKWTSAALKVSRQIVLGLMVLVVLWILYSVSKRYIKMLLEPAKEPAVPEAPAFNDADAVKFVPSVGEPLEVASDKTADAILSGQFGPAVVVFYADWCVHCKNMMDAYESAARKATIPFVKISGASAPVSGRKYGVSGYPTIFGIANVGPGVRRHNGPRTEASFLEFAVGLAGTPSAPPEAPVAAPVIPVPVAVAATAEAVVEPAAEIAVIPPTVHVTEA